jgi:hypothetical protein
VTGGKPIAVLLQSISGVSAINPLDAFYDIHGGKREVIFFYFVPDTTRDNITSIIYNTIIASNKYLQKLLRLTRVYDKITILCLNIRFYTVKTLFATGK